MLMGTTFWCYLLEIIKLMIHKETDLNVKDSGGYGPHFPTEFYNMTDMSNSTWWNFSLKKASTSMRRKTMDGPRSIFCVDTIKKKI